MTKYVIKLAAVLAIVAFVSAAPVQALAAAHPTGIGNNPDSAPTQLSFSADGTAAHWDITGSGGSLLLYYLPTAGPLEKTLTGADYASGNVLNLTETLKIGQAPAWTDWHEEFKSAGLGWIGNPVLTTDAGDIISGVISLDGTKVDFYFPSPLPVNTVITINKDFAPNSVLPPPANIVIDEWPTVTPAPEPGTFALLAAGLVALLAYAWRKRR